MFIIRNRPTPIREWRWTDVPEIGLITGRKGVRIGADPADVIVSQNPPKLATAINWLKFQGAHALAHDRLNEWLDGLSGWLAAAATPAQNTDRPNLGPSTAVHRPWAT